MPTHPQNDHLLEAFRYFNNEMSDTEGAAFEVLLDNNIELQGALSDVVSMQSALSFDAVSAVEPRAVTSPKTTSSPDGYSWGLNSRTAAILSGLVATILLMSPLIVQHSEFDNGVDVAAVQSQQEFHNDMEAVDLWTILENDSNAVAESRQPPARELEDHLTALDNDELSVPDWMFAAVEASQFAKDASDNEEDFDGGAL